MVGRVGGRSSEDTKRLILEAAARVLRRDGVSATLDDIALEAGVSKGGLVYHFRSKQALLLALGESIIQAFRQNVLEHADPEDRRPGSLARAYIRASFAGMGDVVTMRDDITLAANLNSEVDLLPLAEADGRRWREELAADGLPAHILRIVVAATDGVSAGALWGAVLDEHDVRELEAQLLRLTETDAA